MVATGASRRRQWIFSSLSSVARAPWLSSVRGGRCGEERKTSTSEADMKTRTHIYWRDRGGARRAYADLREYADVGGGREALVARGEKRATTDPATAQVLLARRLEQLDGLRRGRGRPRLAAPATAADLAPTPLEAETKRGKGTHTLVALSQLHLHRA